jgi:glycosyltransferase involved in cell wall biosynthesis
MRSRRHYSKINGLPLARIALPTVVDKSQQTYHTLLSCSPESDSSLPPLSQFFRHRWLQTAPANACIQHASDRADFIFTELRSFFATRAPFRPPLSVALIEWLNAPALDVSAHIHTHPTLSGSRSCSLPKQLTRLMMHVWTNHAKHFDLFEEHGFYGFLAWYALHLMKDWKLPVVLLPHTSVDLLNQPVVDDTMPMTVCMLVNERSKQNHLTEAMSRAELFASCFGAMADLLDRNDVRLLPSYVSNFWRRHAFAEGTITTYEYVAATAFRDSAVPETEPAIRNWFASDYAASRPWAKALSGIRPANGRQAAPQKPVDNAVLSYRDHKTVCGLSKAGIQATTALRSTGFDVFDLDYALPRDRMHEEYTHNASLLTNSRRNLHLLNMNPEYVPECLLLNAARVRPRDYIVGQFYWELSNTSVIHETGLALVDEIWVASSYLSAVFSQHTNKPVINMGQAVAEPPASNLGRAHFGLPNKDYLFLLNFDAMSCIERKNPLAAVRAFRRAFPKGSERAGLIIKTRHADQVGGNDLAHWNMVLEEARQDRRIRIINRTFSEAELTGLLAGCDCYVTLHRSEGFGYGAAEALIQGKPVITTAYSGVSDFCTTETSLPVPYELLPAELGAYPYMDADRSYVWASPNIEVASSHMQRLFRNPTEGRTLGEQGQRLIRARYSIQALSERYQTRLAELRFGPASAKARTQ